jgi:hypothetical protein
VGPSWSCGSWIPGRPAHRSRQTVHPVGSRLPGTAFAERARSTRPAYVLQLHFAPVEAWRCPHCGTSQTDGARCWACSRHPLACGSCRHYVRAVAGRLGYCALDRTRAVLQGDEIRACWQAPADPEPYVGLFRDLTPEPTSGDDRTREVSSAAVPSRAGEGGPGTRDWVIPVTGDAEAATTPAAAGLREATHVPARGFARPRPDLVGSADREALGIGQHAAVRQGDTDGDQPIAGHHVRGEADM